MNDKPCSTTSRQPIGSHDGLSAFTAVDVDVPPPFELRLFGPMEVRVGGQPLPRLRSRKGLWLLAVLALRGGRPVDRDWLAGTLWPHCDELHARRSLRQTLHDLRRALGEGAWRLASDEPRSIRLDLERASVDVLVFDTAVDRGDPESLEAAARLYRGPLLEDCAEEWAAEGRRAREQACIGLLERLAAEASSRGEHGRAARWLSSARALDPYREDLLRSLMEAKAADANPAAAIIEYRDYRALLGRELMSEPAEGTTALFRRLRDELRAVGGPAKQLSGDVPAPRASSAAGSRRMLPIPLTPLIGRDEDVRAVVALAERARLITLTGSGGVGKTRLAIRVAEELAPRFRDGAVFVDLAPIREAENLPDAVRAACEAVAREQSQPSLEVLCDHLAARQTLLLLDNCEQLDEACGRFVIHLLGRCPDLTILATSRQVLGVKGETVWRVPSLAAPGTAPGRPVSTRDIGRVSKYLDFAAVRLFADRAAAAEVSFRPSHKNLIPVAMICSRLDGIPLAIELTAARVKSMTVERIAERLNDRFRILLGEASPPNATVPRQETLRASIDWSYELLSPSERTLFERLSVFVGGWTLEAAEEVCAGGTIREWQVLELLTGLVDKSLVTFQPHEDRYRLLETIRQYAVERLHGSDEEWEQHARFVNYFIRLAELADDALTGPDQIAWLNRLDTEHDNLRAAMSMANSASRAAQPGDERGAVAADSGLRLVAALSHFWWVRGYLREGSARIDAALDAGPKTGRQRSRALNQAGTMAFRQGDYAGARQFYEASLAINREIGEPNAIASVLNNLGMVKYGLQEFADSWRFYSESLQIRRETGDRWAIAASLNNLGSVAYRQQEFSTATTLYRESLEIRTALGDSQGIAGSLNNLAALALEKGDFAAARDYQRRSLPIRRDLGDRQGIAASLEALAEAEWRLRTGPGGSADGQAGARASTLLGAAESLREQIGAPLLPDEHEAVERLTEELRRALDPGVMRERWASGRTMNVESAIRLALD